MLVHFNRNWILPRKLRSTSKGFTLIEVIIAMSVLFIAVASIVSATLVCMQLRQLNHEKALARNSAEQVFSAIRGMPSIIDAYNRFGGSGPERAKVKKTATMTAAVAKMTRPE